MCMADHEAAARCRRTWPDEIVDVDGRSVAPRARCTTCRCYTIPVRLVHEADGPCRIEAPGKYPCPVCGQMDQYINVWINARARHHAESQRLLREQGFVTTVFGALRAPFDDELPTVGAVPFTGSAQVGPVASVNTLRVAAGDPQFVAAPTPASAQLCCADCRSLVAT